MARISLRTEGPFATNSYIIDEGDGKCILVDAPAPSIAQAITELGLEVDEVWLTHGHFDHVLGLAAVKEAWPDSRIRIGAGDARMLDAKVAQADLALFGMHPEVAEIPCADVLLSDGDRLPLGYEVVATGGHTSGSVCFYNKYEGILFSGDTLFASSVGRTDLGGDYSALVRSLRRLVSVVDGKAVVLPGHGVSTTMEAERRTNSFLNLL